MGGETKLKELVEGLQALGCKVMAMYGMNIMNKNIPVLEIDNYQCKILHHPL